MRTINFIFQPQAYVFIFFHIVQTTVFMVYNDVGKTFFFTFVFKNG